VGQDLVLHHLEEEWPVLTDLRDVDLVARVNVSVVAAA